MGNRAAKRVKRPKQLDPKLERALEITRDLADRAARAKGLEVVEVALEGSLRRPRVCVYVDGPEGVLLDDCVEVSRSLSGLLEDLDEDPFPGSYALEVSSPGLDRPFQTEADYRRNIGRRVDLQLREARPGGVESFTGVLTNVDDEGIDLELDGGEVARCSFDEIRKIHRSIELERGR